MNRIKIFSRHRSPHGVALVIVLSFVLLLTVLVVAFFSRTITDRQLSNSSLTQSKTDLLARSTLDIVVSDLKQEIVNGSTVTTSGGVTIYTPSASANAIPKSNLTTSAVAAIPNLIRTSLRSDAASRASAANSTSDPSLNGRFISRPRWNKHYLVPTSTTSDSTPVTSFPSPDWVFVTDQGPKVLATPDAGTSGRYAYAIYDEGGLLDLNVAGYPNGVPASDLGKKGFLGLADLTQLPNLTQPQIDNIVGWRNYATVKPDGTFPSLTSSVTTPASYLNYLRTNTAGFLKTNGATWNGTSGAGPARTDQNFLSRQQLLAFQASAGIPASALQYLGTFSRELNSPSIPAGTNATLNPSFANLVRNSKPIHRFSLKNFSLLETNPSSLSQSAKDSILDLFGLAPAAGTSATYRKWVYRSPTIGTPNAAITAGRDPDLFELVKAAIINGSLGSNVANYGLVNETGGSDYSPETNVHQQVARIIANMADQYDTDNYPTTIQIGANEVYGIESLPYFSEIFFKAHFPSGFYTANGALYVYFELWNPHQGAIPNNGPTQVRIRANNDARITMNYIQINSSGGADNPNGSYRRVNSTYQELPPTVPFPTTPIYVSNPALYQSGPLVTDNASDSPTRLNDLTPTINGWKVLSVNQAIPATWNGIPFTSMAMSSFVPVLEYEDANNNWHPYTTFAGHFTAAGTTGIQGGSNAFMNNGYGGGGSGTPDAASPNLSYPKPDPRTFRYRSGVSISASYQTTMFPNATDLQSLHQDKSGDAPDNPGLLYSNQLTQTVADFDGVVRPADGYLGTAANPMASSAARPIMLNRPFRSVAELGYVFRDAPWKSIDLFSDKSGDSGLLDLFCVEDNETTAGQVNINTRNPQVLAALLSGAIRQETSNGNPISSTDATKIAGDIIATTTGANGPIRNRAELPARLPLTTVNATYPAIKTQREATIRAIATNTQTRTWNLLIDLVAESGRFAPGATTLKQFNVEGSRRYWLHLALDRYTGKVIDSQWEVVYE